MKKLVLAAFAILALTFTSQAQTDNTKPQPGKEERARIKAEKDALELQGYQKAGLSEEEITKITDVNKEFTAKNNQLKTANLSDSEKEAKKKELSEEKKDRLKETLGADKYKKWMAARKEIAAQQSTN